MGKKKQTAGEKIMAAWGKYTERVPWVKQTPLARRIDAAIKRAVKDAMHPAVGASIGYRKADRDRVAAKYGVKL